MKKTASKSKSHCGYIAILGRPNVGKSTLLNTLLGEKISITSKKPQTTRQQILGIKTTKNSQFIFVDTPGIHSKAKNTVNKLMNKAAKSAIHDVDIIVFIIDAKNWVNDDEQVLKAIKDADKPIILALNKIDLIKDKLKLLKTLEEMQKKFAFKTIIPISVTKKINLDELENSIQKLLPKNTFLFPGDQITDSNEKFIASEIIREKLFRGTGQEIPYDVAVIIDKMQMEKETLHIFATIWVERQGQKIIIIGKKGDKLKQLGKAARIDLEKKFGCKVYLNLWIKVKAGWSDDEKLLAKIL